MAEPDSRANSESADSGRPRKESIAELADRGDVPAVLARLRSRNLKYISPEDMDAVIKAIRQKQNDDVGGLIEAGFGEIVGLTTTLLLRAQLHVEKRLAECDSFSGDRTEIPRDLTEEGWITRCEKLGRFLMEVVSNRVRVLHVNDLNDRSRAKKYPSLRNGHPFPLDADRIQAAACEAAASDGGSGGQAGRIKFA